ncbi:MAG: tRNA (adenosine(37)-N6)-threonylcarbamoyltransferase complex ATPase subunit type 1 TsaE [Lawsonibacter sp.]|nr:tRNA (adenosine(37)-N6)-threonylcarbamoyltransferase complex ATPase subunit type 1 TsaE [Lawsonibacter sp.]
MKTIRYGNNKLCRDPVARQPVHTSDELFDIGWEDYLARGGVCAVEWSENISDALEEDAVLVDIRQGTSDSQRVITVEGVSL